MPSGPCHSEIPLDEVGTLLIHGFHEIDGFLLSLAPCLKPTDLVGKRRIDEDVKRVFAVSQVVGGAPADDDAIAGLSEFGQDLLRNCSDAIRIHQPELWCVRAPFKAA